MKHLQDLKVQIIVVILLELLCACGVYFVKADLFSTVAILVMMLFHVAIIIWVALQMYKNAKKKKKKVI